MQALPAEPSFSVLHSTLGREPLSGTEATFEAVCAGLDAAIPYVAVVPRVTMSAVRKWSEKKHETIRRLCERIQDLHDQAEKAMQTKEKRVTPAWVSTYETLLVEFIVFAVGYEKKRRVFARLTRQITSEHDQRAIAAFIDRIDDLFMDLKGVGTAPSSARGDEDYDSASTAASSP